MRGAVNRRMTVMKRSEMQGPEQAAARSAAAGFTRLWQKRIDYLGMCIEAYRHPSGLEVILVDCDDVENVFMAGFRTEGTDDTGVQHIIEHVVLGGSRNYQVKDPCEELERGSLATYINAETYQDRTLYVYAGICESEFLNGVDVYLDAVFQPLLREETFRQEGWRYVLEDDGQGGERLRTTGIVLNERRAQLDDVEDMALCVAYRELLPGHPLSYDSGGLPGCIEKLDYDSFKEYYRRHYGVSRARLFFYGSIPAEVKLARVAAYLEANVTADGRKLPLPEEKKRKVVPQWLSPRRVEVPLAVEAARPDGDDCCWTLNWRLGVLSGASEQLAMELLTILLLEDDSSPLRKALLESGLCEDVMDCSDFETEHEECLFIVGVLNCRLDAFDDLRSVCIDCLEECRRRGFAEEQVRAAFNQLRLRYQEVMNGYGLMVGRQVMRNWLSGQEPLSGVDYREGLGVLQAFMEQDSQYLENLLARYLLNNPHRLEVRFVADAGLAERRRVEEERKWQRRLKRMTETEKRRLKEEEEAFRRFRESGDSAEAVAAFPRVGRSGLPAEPFNPSVSRRVLPNGVTVVRGEARSDGVNYVRLGFDAMMFSAEARLWLPIFACLQDAVGVRRGKYGEFERRLGLAGAEMSVESQLFEGDTGKPGLKASLTMRMGALSDCWEAALECLVERWRESVYTEKRRIREVLSQSWSQMRQRLYSEDDALEYATGRSAAGISRHDTVYDRWYGVSGAGRLKDALKLSRGRSEVLTERMAAMQKVVAGRLPQVVSYVGDDKGYEQLLGLLVDGTPCEPWRNLPPEECVCDEALGRREGLSNGRLECCCVRSLPVCGYGEDGWAALCVLAELLGEGFLLDRIRLDGGAYGVGCSYYPSHRLLQMVSYRDPRPEHTFAVFGQAAGRREEWSERQVIGAIAGCVRSDVPLRAAECCQAVLTREIIGLENDVRQVRRRQLLAVTPADVCRAAEQLREYASAGWNDCLIGDRRCLKQLDFHNISWGQ